MSKSIVKSRAQQTLWSVLGACLVGYFLYHTLEGDRGWFSQMRLERDVVTAQSSLQQLQNERQQLSHRVQLLHPDSLDPDLLEEKSRELLNYSKPNEIIVLTPQNAPPSKPAVNGNVQRTK